MRSGEEAPKALKKFRSIGKDQDESMDPGFADKSRCSDANRGAILSDKACDRS